MNSWHMPDEQPKPAPHGLPHLPQLFGSTLVSTQVPLQLDSPAWQLSPQVPPEQTLPARHLTPGDPTPLAPQPVVAPQLVRSVPGSMHLPPQLTSPLWQVSPQVPPEQTFPAAHVVPAVPEAASHVALAPQ